MIGASRSLLIRPGFIANSTDTMMGSHVNRGFWEAVGKSVGVIGASEIGDKTFFIAAIMAMKNHKWTVFSGALAALSAMTVLSAALGWAAPALIPKVYTHYAATLMFFFFGFKTLYDALTGGDEKEGESELEQVEAELQQANGNTRGSKKELLEKDKSSSSSALLGLLQQVLGALFSPVFLKAFTLTFLAEWGDRSQIATIGLAASADVVGVTVGSIVGHAACTAAAVLGGRHLATHIDERTVGIIGGLLFLLFGAHALWQGPEH